ncbi:unnamed protein product [Paramecium primaurelia]|uniref:Ubiquitin-like domain-containing protein n=1 Tax=Paramecium primaurelia TaxID=5886 RepID=A0A8S1K580_PARPR|nr:unnamed protein product [Paramecium primaurelia]
MNYLTGQEQRQGGSDQPNQITINVVVNLPQSTLKISVNINHDIPFDTFVNGIKEQIFAQKMKAQYEETIEYLMEDGSIIQSSESRSLQSLGFKNNCTLQVRLMLKGG